MLCAAMPAPPAATRPRPLASAAQAAFAATLVVLGVLGLGNGALSTLWQPLPAGRAARELLTALSALVCLASGSGLFFRPRIAARALLVYLLLWLLLGKLPVAVRAPAVAVGWESCAETLVVLAAAWVLCASLTSAAGGWGLRFVSGATGMQTGRTLYGLALIPLGSAHLAYLRQTAALVPGWLPWHLAWAQLTGCAYIAAGLAVIGGVLAPAAAALSAVQMGLFTLLVWVPAITAAGAGAEQWGEGMLSLTLTMAAWVVADSYRRRRAHLEHAARGLHLGERREGGGGTGARRPR